MNDRAWQHPWLRVSASSARSSRCAGIRSRARWWRRRWRRRSGSGRDPPRRLVELI